VTNYEDAHYGRADLNRLSALVATDLEEDFEVKRYGWAGDTITVFDGEADPVGVIRVIIFCGAAIGLVAPQKCEFG
jgi:hypothetical protein